MNYSTAAPGIDFLAEKSAKSQHRIVLNFPFDETSTKALLLGDISQIIALDKSDLLDENSIEALIRQIWLDNNAESAVSAIHPETLKLLIEKIKRSLAKSLT